MILDDRVGVKLRPGIASRHSSCCRDDGGYSGVAGVSVVEDEDFLRWLHFLVG